MPFISKLAMQTAFLFVLACAAVVASNLEHRMMRSAGVDWAVEVRAKPSMPDSRMVAGELDSPLQIQPPPIDLARRAAE